MLSTVSLLLVTSQQELIQRSTRDGRSDRGPDIEPLACSTSLQVAEWRVAACVSMIVRVVSTETERCDTMSTTPVARIVGFPECKTLSRDDRVASCETLGSPMSLPESPLSRMLKTASWPCLRLKIHKPRGSASISAETTEVTLGLHTPGPSVRSLSPDNGNHAVPICIPRIARCASVRDRIGTLHNSCSCCELPMPHMCTLTNTVCSCSSQSVSSTDTSGQEACEQSSKALLCIANGLQFYNGEHDPGQNNQMDPVDDAEMTFGSLTDPR